MELPVVFEQDIQSKVLNITTRVVIGEDNPIYLSTHNLTFEGKYYKPYLLSIPKMKESIDYESRKFKISNVTLKVSNYKYNGERFSDSLKSNPLINEKSDIYWNSQSANSSGDTLLVFRGYVRRISHNDSQVTIELEDLTEKTLHKMVPSERTSDSLSVGKKYRDVPIPMAFGVLHDAPTVLDAGNVLKADSDESIMLINQNSPHYEQHLVWGDITDYTENDYSPVKVYEGSSMLHISKEVGYELAHEVDDNNNVTESSPLDHTQFLDEWDSYGAEQSGTLILTPFPTGFAADRKHSLQVYGSSKPSSITCHLRASNSVGNHDGINFSTGNYQATAGWNTPNRFREKVVDNLTDDDYTFNTMEYLNGGDLMHEWSADNGNHFDYNNALSNGANQFWNEAANSAQSLIQVRFPWIPEYSISSMMHPLSVAPTHLAINKIPINWQDDENIDHLNITILTRTQHHINAWALRDKADSLGTDNTSYYYLDGYAMEADGSNGEFLQDFNNIFQSVMDGQVDSHPDYRGREFPLSDKPISLINVRALSIDIFEGGPFIRIRNVAYLNPNQLDPNASGDYIVIEIGDYIGAGGPYGRAFEAGIGGEWSEIDLFHNADIEFSKEADYYLEITGRREGGNLLRNPIDILKNIAVDELGIEDIDGDSYDIAKIINSDLKFDFSVTEEIKSKDLFEDISKSTLCYPYFNNQGELSFSSYKPSYTTDDYYAAKVIKDFDVLSFSFNKTKLEQVYTGIKFKYNHNSASGKYNSSIDLHGPTYTFSNGLWADDVPWLSSEELAYNGYSDISDNVLEFESPYIKDDLTAGKVWTYMCRDYQYQHLTCKIKLPLHYIHLDVGDVIKFDKLLGDMRAFGIDYTKVSNLVSNEKTAVYPMFFVTSINKNLDSIQIEARQIHHIDNSAFDFEAWDYDDVAPEVEPEDEDIDISEEDIEFYDAFNINNDGLNGFKTIHNDYTLKNVDILHWFEPSAFGLDSFNQFIPSNWDSYNASGIRNYEAIKFSICIEGPWRVIVTLGNISESDLATNFELGWKAQLVHADDVDSTQDDDYTDNWFDLDGREEGDYLLPHNSSLSEGENNEIHMILIGDGLKKAINEGLAIVDLTFYADVDIMIATYGYGLGDVTGDGTINILDIVQITNHILAPEGYSALDSLGVQSADYNQDGTINILDIMAIINHIVGGGD